MSTLEKRVAAFRKRSGAVFDTSLRAAGEHRAIDQAISNWIFTRNEARPSCFGCHTSPIDRVGAFLTAAPIDNRNFVAVAGLCERCWLGKSAAEIEADALAVLRRQLKSNGRFI